MYQVGPVSTAILAVLNAITVPGKPNLKVGASIKPGPVGAVGRQADGSFIPYGVLYPVIGGVGSGPLDEPEEDFESIFQVTCVGASQTMAEWVSDRVRVALMTVPIVVPGRTVVRVRTDMSGGIQRDDDVQPPLFYMADRYRIVTTES